MTPAGQEHTSAAGDQIAEHMRPSEQANGLDLGEAVEQAIEESKPLEDTTKDE